MNSRKYPTRLFIIGWITNILFRFFWLFVPSIVLLVVGIFVKPCLYIGLAILWLNIVVSLIEQIRIRQAFLEESDDPNFKAFQDTLSNEGDWKHNIFEFVNKKMSDPQNQIKPDDETEDE